MFVDDKCKQMIGAEGKVFTQLHNLGTLPELCTRLHSLWAESSSVQLYRSSPFWCGTHSWGFLV